MKKIMNVFVLGLILMLTACSFNKEEEKKGWDKHNPSTLETVTYRGKYTRDQTGGYYKNRAELLSAFNDYAIEKYQNVNSSFNVANRIKTGEFAGSYIVDEIPYSERDKVETTTVEEVKQKLQKYKIENPNSCLGFPNFSYNSIQIMIYYLDEDKLMYQFYNSSKHGW